MRTDEVGALTAPRLVAFDVDGTLVGRDLAISNGVREAVARMRQAGITGCLVTGRMYRATLPFARELAFDAPLICYQGAAIIDPTTDELLAHSALENDIVRELIAACRAGPDALCSSIATTSTTARRATDSRNSMRRSRMTQPVIVSVAARGVRL